MTRAGNYIKQLTGYQAFVPKPLPPDPPILLDDELVLLLSQASIALGKLAGLASIISDPDLFVYLYVRKEALLSSQIEGTQCSLEDVLSPADKMTPNHNIIEVSNYVRAMNQGLAQIKNIPVSTRLIKEMHAVLMTEARGSNKTPGQFRKSQNWIGRPGAILNTAEFVPPPFTEIDDHMSDLEKFIHSQNSMAPLIKAALIHAQFETIHPFLDGNGRLGRLLITYLLCYWRVLDRPLLYLSYYFKAYRTEYYAKLMDVRFKGDWEGWIKFFLKAVSESAEMAKTAALEIHHLHQSNREALQQSKPTAYTLQVFNEFCKAPIWTVQELLAQHNSSKPKIQRAIDHLIELGFLQETSGKQRNRKYAYASYLQILTRDTTTKIG
ncbi:Fic family protein [bacterium]|nr:Fic family protein [bacterium]